MRLLVKTRFLKKRQGLTLIELLVSLGILTVLLSVALPSYQQLINKTKLVNLAQLLVEDLKLARQYALTRGEKYYFRFSDNVQTPCWSISERSDCTCGSGCSITEYLLESQYQQIVIDATRNAISFSYLQGTTNGTTYQLSAPDNAVKVKVSTQGRITACMHQQSSSTYDRC